jgi:putative cardiolipin synthase
LKIIRPKKTGSGFSGSSRASLHAKVFVFDRKNIFIGSMNLDPRSVSLNSELGVVFTNPDFASELVRAIEKTLLENSYHVRLVERQDEELSLSYETLVWDTIEAGQQRTYTSEPHVGFFRKLGVWFMSLFVSEELL